MTNKPLVSIIIPTFNRAHLIVETLDSVLVQTYQNWECIVVDDGSSDHTDEVVGEYVKKDARFKYFHRPDEHLPGGNGARNYGFKMSKGDYVNWLDSDDLFANNKIEKQLQSLGNKTDSISTCAWARIEDSNSFKLKELEIYKDYITANNIFMYYGAKGFFPSHSFLCERSVIHKSGLWDEKLIINQDGEFFCRVIFNSESIVFTPNTYVLYRKNSNIKTSHFSSIEKAEASIESWKLIEKYLKVNNVKAKQYIENAKNYIFYKIKLSYPDLIKEHNDFFETQIKYNTIRGRIKRKVNTFLK
jgi:glycosyltransferase involved in cell wall biosynthesis